MHSKGIPGVMKHSFVALADEHMPVLVVVVATTTCPEITNACFA